MKTKYRGSRAAVVRLCRQRIEKLFLQAEEAFDESKDLAKRYVSLARKISTKYKVYIPNNLKRRYCKNCGNYLKPGRNCRVRNTNSKIVYFCTDCKSFMRFMIK